MALRPDILLQGRVPNVQQTFSNALLNIQRGEQLQQAQAQAEREEQLQPFRQRLLQAQTTTAEQGVLTPQQQLNTRDQAKLDSIANFARQNLDLVAEGPNQNLPSFARRLAQRRGELVKAKLPTTETDQGFQLLEQNPQALASELSKAIQAQDVISGRGQRAGLASAKTEILDDGSVIQALPSGEVQVRNPAGQIVTGQERANVLGKSRQAGLSQQQREADIEVSTAQRKAAATGRESRISAIRQEQSERNRIASRAESRIGEALKLSEKATQGFTAGIKLQAARIFPGIDVADESQLSAAFTNLAVDELQRIKGPTTDFEFGKMESITGTITDSRSANVARLKSLKRAVWYSKRESQQFNKFVRAGGDPDEFAFNINETVKAGDVTISLLDLRDTAAFHNLTIEETLRRLSK